MIATKTKHSIKMSVMIASLSITLFFALAMAVSAQNVEVGVAETGATQSVIRDQLEAFRSMDHDRAYSHAAPNIKQYFPSVDRFATMVKNGYGAIYNSDSFVMGRNTFISGEIYQEVIITDQSGKQWQAVYTLKQQTDGSWKITGVKMNPYKGATT